ncbi:hypothetical protein G6F56_007135 [Rhizopus delemar]|nr:hypothetical protein G6F56_007135 [Rhizopus delemar]
MLGRAIIRARGVQIKPLVSLARKTTPLTPVEKTIETAAVPTEKEFLATMDQCKATGDIVEAIKAVQKAEEFGLASPELYRHLLEIVNSAPFDIEYTQDGLSFW